MTDNLLRGLIMRSRRTARHVRQNAAQQLDLMLGRGQAPCLVLAVMADARTHLAAAALDRTPDDIGPGHMQRPVMVASAVGRCLPEIADLLAEPLGASEAFVVMLDLGQVFVHVCRVLPGRESIDFARHLGTRVMRAEI